MLENLKRSVAWLAIPRGTELGAAHFDGLDEQGRVQAALLGDSTPGLVRWDRHCSLTCAAVSGGLEVSCGEVLGLTPGLHAVALSGPFRLRTTLAAAGEFATFDAAIIVNVPAPVGQGERLVLLIEPAAEDAPDPAPRPNRLALGRFRCRVRGGPPVVELTRHGAVRTFAAIRPLDDPAWLSWVKPLKRRMEAADRAAHRARPPLTLDAVSLAQLTAELTYRWPSLTMRQLVAALRMLRWLSRGRPPLNYEEEAAAAPSLTSYADDWPRLLVASLGESSAARRPGAAGRAAAGTEALARGRPGRAELPQRHPRGQPGAALARGELAGAGRPPGDGLRRRRHGGAPGAAGGQPFGARPVPRRRPRLPGAAARRGGQPAPSPVRG